MGALIDYWYYTGDTRWNNITEEGLLFQVGQHNDYMPRNQTRTEGNDDQGFWGMAVMSAAEYKFQNPPDDKPQWLALAQAVFNTQAARWDEEECGGGLRWQIFTWNNGYDYKNSISQACFFNIAARLALYTGNQSYAYWADKTWDWMEATELLSPGTYYVYDGAHTQNCSDMSPYQWTYNAGAFLLGAAAMYNYTGAGTDRARQAVWRERVDGLLNGTAVFFAGPAADIMSEVACEPVDMCDLDQQSFKAYLARWMAAATKWAPWMLTRVKPLLATSATAAASTCLGGPNGRMCGLKWTEAGKWDGSTGVGQQMAAMEVVLANLIEAAAEPATDGTGGTSVGDPGAGGSDVGRTNPFEFVDSTPPVTTAGRAGAYICTVLVAAGLVAGCVFVLADEGSTQAAARRWAGLRSSWGSRSGKSSDVHAVRTPEKDDDIVIKTREDVGLGLEEGDTVAAAAITPCCRTARPRSTLSDTSSYWSAADCNTSPSVGRGHRYYQQQRQLQQLQQQHEKRLSYPGPTKRASAMRKRTEAKDRNRVVRWRETKQYV